MRIGQAWRAVRDRFRAAGLVTPELDARLLAQHVLGLDRLGIVQREGDPVSPDALASLDALADRRLAGEPVERIVGEKEFFGLAFTLSPDTLGPRPETEMLVELGLTHLAGITGARFLDLGTGSGCIAIALLVEQAGLDGLATDLSAGALTAARRNAERHAVAGRLTLREGAWFEPVAPGERFALIVSNPPYIETDALAGLAPEVRFHDPLLALDGGVDGLDAYRVIVAGAPDHLEPGGVLMVEIGSRQGAAVAALMERAGLTRVRIEKDLAGLDRVVVGHHV